MTVVRNINFTFGQVRKLSDTLGCIWMCFYAFQFWFGLVWKGLSPLAVQAQPGRLANSQNPLLKDCEAQHRACQAPLRRGGHSFPAHRSWHAFQLFCWIFSSLERFEVFGGFYRFSEVFGGVSKFWGVFGVFVFLAVFGVFWKFFAVFRRFFHVCCCFLRFLSFLMFLPVFGGFLGPFGGFWSFLFLRFL